MVYKMKMRKSLRANYIIATILMLTVIVIAIGTAFSDADGQATVGVLGVGSSIISIMYLGDKLKEGMKNNHNNDIPGGK